MLETGMESFRYVVMAARRARQLQNGSQPLIDSRSNKACRVAQEEIAAGKVTAGEQPRYQEADYQPEAEFHSKPAFHAEPAFTSAPEVRSESQFASEHQDFKPELESESEPESGQES